MHPGMLRYPDCSATQVVFVYNNDIWVAPLAGGEARPLSSPPGEERFPRFSPDGSLVAFSAGYDGGEDVYEIPAAGGTPRRLTVQPYGARVCGYSPDGRVVFASFDPETFAERTLWYAAPDGGLPERLPLIYGDLPSFSADGGWIAFTPYRHYWQDDSWNRYRGGQAADIWTFDLATHEARQLTDWAGTDDCPMVEGGQVYYLSDAGPEGRRNIWVCDPVTGGKSQLTRFSDGEVRWPSSGPGGIVFQQGGKLWRLPLETLTPQELHISLAGDRPNLRPRTLLLEGPPENAALSPQGKRLAIEKRGDIWSIPALKGPALCLTPTEGSAEREPAWSPDGKSVAYISDASGQYEVYVRPADGSGEARQLTSGSRYRMQQLSWSPDSKRIAYVDRSAAYYIVDAAEGGQKRIAQDAYNSFGPWSLDWSPDSRWLAYALYDLQTTNRTVQVFDTEQQEAHAVTAPAFECFSPCFDSGGDFLYYVTLQGLSPQFSDVDDWDSFLFAGSGLLAALPLRADVGSPFLPKSDEEAPAAEGAEGDGAEPGAESEAGPGPAAEAAPAVEIDFEGIEGRGILLPAGGGNLSDLRAAKGRLYYLSYELDYDAPEQSGDLHAFDLAAAAADDPDLAPEKLLAEGVRGYQLTPDGSQILLREAGGGLAVLPADAPPAEPGAPAGRPVPLPPLRKELDPQQEWRQMIWEDYRAFKEEFYDPGLHGVDWEAARDRALALLPYAGCSEDIGFIISEMNAELSVGHAYIMPGQSSAGEHFGLGLLGCDFERAFDADGRAGIRISHIYRGAEWEPAARGPLEEPGAAVRAGDFLLGINGTSVTADMNPYALLIGQAGQTLRLTVGGRAARDESAREVLVRALPDDMELRHRDWVERKRRQVEEASGGRVGYIHVRDTWIPGLVDLQRQFLGQHNREALIIDDRYNGGGFVPQRFIELLSRPLRMYDAMQSGASWRTPRRAHIGPKVMLINQYAGSGGDGFPWLFRQSSLGSIVGVRSWGGFVGIWGAKVLLDGTAVSVPASGSFDAGGEWVVEGYGVDPDIAVLNDPASLAAGRDLQLETAIASALAAADAQPQAPVSKPPYPTPGRR